MYHYCLWTCLQRTLLISAGIGIVTHALNNAFNAAVCTSIINCGDGGLVSGIPLVHGFVVSSRGRGMIARSFQQQEQRRRTTITRERVEFFLLATKKIVPDDNGEEAKPKKKKSKKIVINPDLNCDSFGEGGVAAISSDGVVEVSPKLAQQKRSTFNLGVPSKRKMKDIINNNNNNNSGSKNKRLSAKALKIKKQRTANGLVDSSTKVSSSSSTTASKVQNPLEEEEVRIAIGKRGSKVVTMIQGMTLTTMEDRKKLLKALKAKVGGGGTLVEGVLELQGPHSETAMQFLKSKGYTKTKIVGGGGKKKGKGKKK